MTVFSTPLGRVQVLLAAAAIAVGCGSESAERVVASAPVDTVRMQLSWEVSEGKHPTADSLGDLSGIAVDRAGNVYVSDRAAIKIWVFDSAGRSLDAVGRKGEGPGEFESPTGIAISPDEQLYVRDVYFVSGFTVDPSTGLLSRYVDNFRGPLYGDWRPRARVASPPDQNAACFIRRTRSRTGLRARPSITSTTPFPKDA